MSANALEIYKNNSKTLIVNVTDGDGMIFNCSGYTPYFSVKRNTDDLEFLINLTGTTSGISGATLTFNITSSMTSITSGEYCYDVTLLKDNGDVRSVIVDKLKILGNVKYGI